MKNGQKYSYICRYDVTYAEFKTLQLYNFVDLTKTLQNFVQDSFFIKLTKICHKDWGKVLVSGPLESIVEISHLPINSTLSKTVSNLLCSKLNLVHNTVFTVPIT